MYNISVQEVGETVLMLLINVLDTGGGGGGVSPSHGGAFLEFWVLNSGFWCIIKLKLVV